MSESRWVSIRTGSPELALPLVCDSPHSGTTYPEDFGHAIALWALRSAEDTHVDALWAHAPEAGATLIAARFPRTYIDVNRPLSALEPSMLDGAWEGPMAVSAKTERGTGLIWRQVAAEQPIYDRKLTVAEVQRRIETCWKPYHDALRRAIDEAQGRWGTCWHLNLHSMPHNAYERLGIKSSTALADIVLGDRRGKTCSREFMEVVKRAIEAHGYRVAVNDPYEGAEIVRAIGEPASGRHSVQIEINRSIYMDERTREPSAEFDSIRHDLSSVLEEVARYIRGVLHSSPAQQR